MVLVESDLEFSHTRNDVSRIEGVVILNEAEAIHEFDLGDIAGSFLEMTLDVFLGDCGPHSVVSRVPEGHWYGR